MTSADQLGLFGPTDPTEPEGFRYQSDLITPDEERHLVDHVRALPLETFDFQGHTASRRNLSFGHRYDWDARQLVRTDPIPQFLLPVREKAASFADLRPEDLAHVLVTEYTRGTPIGWHKDKFTFGQVVGVSLLSPCTFRLRRQLPDGKWHRHTITAQPRSAYLLSGPSRTEWEHSIPPVEQLRYSLTFRSLASGRAAPLPPRR